MTSFGWGRKPEVPCRKILWHVKKWLASMNKNTWQSHIHYSFRPFLFLATRWLCWWDCQRAVVDESGVFLCRHHSTMVPHAHILPGGWRIGSLFLSTSRSCELSLPVAISYQYDYSVSIYNLNHACYMRSSSDAERQHCWWISMSSSEVDSRVVLWYTPCAKLQVDHTTQHRKNQHSSSSCIFISCLQKCLLVRWDVYSFGQRDILCESSSCLLAFMK
jgi:hypothetical protein